ncbi:MULTISPECIES: NtaA/DmoA family FMN-dependent monooxygenase [Brachybacterium]|uniref:LLM class flavin-dependent oxidoreductase n=2 Tax=Brachybacterium TaxID=43668 RepID=A0A2A3YJR6_9MICO|nr:MULTISPECIES: NtaA/DmoA family FMN-dependent monooxygenase [Brachybacterium]PCC34088.1 LLM class flavin-dependent oxidoreductase [Brachybacterium alimentarium]PCC39531.1 LLM class flavin-dependent oxidoreductase [Brachybacterium alimentarium]RCS64743.1 LLM class flavin-dependent oxidoreductase [Brachybacterium sp. JB7]RCS70991.1 LLM class flavin-dependent oxidoreductase [Brachybacterium alimentarium]RCS74800.1 LLM class flavin-dependent oxidoreductase [Brachybacterium alimentarium]
MIGVPVAPKPLILNLFEMNCVGHITHGLWRLPGNNRHRYTDVTYWTELARLAEDGGFTAIFIADVVGAYDVYGGSAETALREGMQIPNNDPMMVVPAMAAVTERLGFGITFSTSYEPPFSFARRMSTLDHLTGGRVGWNIVTSYLPNAARNFGLAEEIDHDHRYEIADEYLEVLYKLWEGSWDDGAVLRDAEHNVYTDPSKVHRINHQGTNFSVAGPHLSEPSPQRTPTLILATASPAGAVRAGQNAEVVFTHGPLLERTVPAVRAAAEEAGRDPADPKFVVQAAVITGRTQQEVDEKLAQYQEHRSAEGMLVHQSVPIRALDHPRDRTIAEALEIEGLPADTPVGRKGGASTIGELLDAVDEAWQDRFFVAGTPEVVADAIEHWLDVDGIDGINLRQYHSYDTVKDFAELVSPILRERGRLPERNGTLRSQLTGTDTLPATHPAARFRGAFADVGV